MNSGSHNVHSKISPSASTRWLNCPASVRKLDDLISQGILGQQEETSAAASEGTKAHDLAEAWIVYHLFDHGKPEEIPNADIQMYIDHCVNLCKANGRHFVEEQVPLFYFKLKPGDTYWIETRPDEDFGGEVETIHLIKPDPRNVRGTITEGELTAEQCEKYQNRGTLDFATYDPDVNTLYVRDLKYGFKIVESRRNAPMSIYAKSLVDSVVWDADWDDVDLDTLRINIAIVQPRVSHNIQEWEVTWQELETFCEPIQEVATNIINGTNLTFGPSEDSCLWCRCKHHCAARIGPVNDLIERLPADYGDFTSVDPVLVHSLWNRRKEITKLLTSIDEDYNKRAASGQLPSGTKFIKGRSGNKRWRKGAEEALVQIISEENLYTSKVKTPTQILKDATDSQINALKGLIEQPQGKPQLVSETDKRPEIKAKSELTIDDFNA